MNLRLLFVLLLAATTSATPGCSGSPHSRTLGDQDAVEIPCLVDEDCGAGRWCDAGVCTAIATDGDAVEREAAGDEDPEPEASEEASVPEESPDAPEDEQQADLEGEVETELEPEREEVPPPAYPPDAWGPHQAGELDFSWRDTTRGGLLGRDVATKVWYPAEAPASGAAKVRYLGLIEGLAYAGAAPDRSGAPYPLVLFSHGNKGVNFQSFSFTSRLAGHGFIVAAPNHEGNTMYNDPDDKEVAQIALDRPIDIEFVRQKLAEYNENPVNMLYHMIDMTRVGIAGHSFGGFTTLLLAGGTVKVDEARARCEAGTEADIFCPYIGYWTAGGAVSRPSTCQHLMAAVGMAPGGYAAFGDDGLANIDMPVLVMGGSLDEFLRPELRPLYAASPTPKAKVEIAGMGHMGFTDICRIPAVSLIPTLKDMCNTDVFINIDRGWEIINPFAIAFIRLYLNGEESMRPYLTAEYAARFPEATFDAALP